MSPAAEWVSQLLEGWADTIAARFCASVYLVGSALTEERPRDVDVRVVLPDDLYESRYGHFTQRHRLGPRDPDDGVLRWMADTAKLGAYLQRNHGNGKLNFDFQIQSETEVWHFGYSDRPKIRLDRLDVALNRQENLDG